MRRDHRPYFIKQAYLKIQKFYAKHFLNPGFESIGTGFFFVKPWYIELFGSPIAVGDFATIISTPDKRVRLSVWSSQKDITGIKIGNYCLLSPGVRISAGKEIKIADNCMLANGVYITDSDWHGIYDRVFNIGKSKPVSLESNVWIGDSCIICKGVTIGKNSIIGAGSVVVNNIPENVIAAGNPAKIIKHLDSDKEFLTRKDLFADPDKFALNLKLWDKEVLKNNTLLHWIRHLLHPMRRD